MAKVMELLLLPHDELCNTQFGFTKAKVQLWPVHT